MNETFYYRSQGPNEPPRRNVWNGSLSTDGASQHPTGCSVCASSGGAGSAISNRAVHGATTFKHRWRQSMIAVSSLSVVLFVLLLMV